MLRERMSGRKPSNIIPETRAKRSEGGLDVPSSRLGCWGLGEARCRDARPEMRERWRNDCRKGRVACLSSAGRRGRSKVGDRGGCVLGAATLR